MEFRLSSQGNRSLQSYWRRRAHRRNKDAEARKKSPVVRLGGGRKRRWRLWRKVVVRPVVRFARARVPPPANTMAKLRDSYMDAMLQLSGLMVARSVSSVGTIWDRRIPRGRDDGLKLGDFERRHLLHLYNSIIATH